MIWSPLSSAPIASRNESYRPSAALETTALEHERGKPIASVTQIHHGANLRHCLCTLPVSHGVVSSARHARRSGKRRQWSEPPSLRTWPCAKPPASSGSPIRARRLPKHSASAARPSTGASCHSSSWSRCRGARVWYRSTSCSGCSRSAASRLEHNRNPARGPDAPRRSRRMSSIEFRPSMPPAAVLPRSRASSPPTRYRQRTVARGGGRRPCALSFADPQTDRGRRRTSR